MASPTGDPGPVKGAVRASPARRARESRTARQGLWVLSLLGIGVAVALIILTGDGGAAANVPRALQIGTGPEATHRGTSSPRPTSTTSIASTTTSIASTTTLLTTTTVKMVHVTTTTQLPPSVTIVRHKSRVTEKDDGGGSDDSKAGGSDN